MNIQKLGAIGVVTALSIATAGCTAHSPSTPAAAATGTAASAATTGPVTTTSSSPASTTFTPTQTPSTRPTAAAPDPTKVVGGSWLPSSHFPLVGKMAWQLDPGRPNGVTVDVPMEEQSAFFLCQAASMASIGVKGLQWTNYHLDPAPVPNNKQVQQNQFFFADAASAKTGLTTIGKWHANCATSTSALPLPATSKKTASISGGASYLDVNSADAYHEYFVQRGAVIDAVIIEGYDAAAPSVKDTGQDLTTLNAMASRLCAYSGAC